ncbi:ATP-binding protein [Micromonospora sp. DT81.3]|uniref:ATP-binding protein n=1 Tax=Micromonospora sp. DT81.3 TaxID=3416523 RepID=UPI003CF91FF6
MGEFEERLSYLVDLGRLVGRIRVDHAPRGLGKTSLLRQYQRRAREREAQTIWVTAGEEGVGLIAQIAAEIERESSTWRSGARTALGRHLESLTLRAGIPQIVGVEAKLKPDVAATAGGYREFEAVLRLAASSDDHTGLVILVDEIQAADPAGLLTLAYAWQHLQSEGSGVPAAVFTAGLPNAPEKIASAVTFSERFAYRPLLLLGREAEEVAISAPARHLGVVWEDDALAAAFELAAGYPYAVQLIADATWTAAGHPDPGGRITVDHVTVGRHAMQADLDALFRARWANATAAERELMTAMASLGDEPVQRAEVARVLGVSSESLSMPRARLIDKGFIQSGSRGKIEFTIPGFAAFIRDLDG